MNGSQWGEPSIGSMTSRRIQRMAYCVCVVLAFAAVPAEGATKRTVKSELNRLAAAGQITTTDRDERLSFFNATKRAAKRLPRGTTRKTELTGVVANVEGIARLKRLTGPRLVPLWLTLERNRTYWTTHTTGPSTRRITVPGLRADLAVLPGPGPAVPPARQLRAPQPAVGRARRRDEHAARRAARARRPARRRHRLGVLLLLRRRPPAVGLRARAGHGHPVDRPRRQADGPRGGDLPDRAPGAGRVQDRDAGGRARPDLRRRRVRALLVRPEPARHQRLRAGARGPLRPRQDRRRHRRAGALRRGRERRAARRCRPTTPAPGRCTRAAPASTSPTSPTTSCCARSCAACAPAPTIPSTATPSCASRSTSSSSRSSRSPPRRCAAARWARSRCGCRRSRASGSSSRAAARSRT